MKKDKILINIIRLSITLLFILIWEILGRLNIINVFITSYPSLIIKTTINLFINNNLIYHIYITTYEVIISFIIVFITSMIISILMYRFYIFDKVIEPYLILLNSMPKVALGPLIIIMIGSNIKSIIFMAFLIAIITSIETISNGFKNTNESRIKIIKSFGASNIDIIKYVVIPSNYKTIISSYKITISLCLIGTIMGEFLTSKAGIGYIILYGSQVFNISLVMSGILILLALSLCFYFIIKVIEKRLD